MRCAAEGMRRALLAGPLLSQAAAATAAAAVGVLPGGSGGLPLPPRPSGCAPAISVSRLPGTCVVKSCGVKELVPVA